MFSLYTFLFSFDGQRQIFHYVLEIITIYQFQQIRRTVHPTNFYFSFFNDVLELSKNTFSIHCFVLNLFL